MADPATYQGRPVTELTREELIEAYTRLSKAYTEYRESMIKMDECSARLASMRPLTDQVRDAL